MKQTCIQIALFILLLLAFIGKINAHGGEDHGEKQKTHATSVYFSSENSSEKYEVLIKYGEMVPGKEAHLTLFLSEVNSNMPVDNAIIKVSNIDDANQSFELSKNEKGIYELHTVFNEKKSNKLNVSIQASPGADLIQVSDIESGKSLPVQNTEDKSENKAFGMSNILYMAVALLIGLGIGLWMKRKTKAGPSAISMFLLMVFVFSPAVNYSVWAHGGEDHGKSQSNSTAILSSLTVAKETQFLFDVRTFKLESGSFSPSINVFGTIIPASSGKAIVQTPQTGVIKSLHVSVGQMVSKGQLLASVEQNVDANTQVGWQTQKNGLDAELSAAKKEYDRLTAISDIVAKRDLDEAERRYLTAKQNVRTFDQLGSSNKNNSKLIFLYAPIDGKIDNFNLSMGSTVNGAQEIFSITNLKSVMVEAQVFDKDIQHVKDGKEFVITNPLNQQLIKLKLISIAPSVNASNQSQRVLFEMDNSGEVFNIGEFVNVRVFKPSDNRQMTVPNSAITELNGKSVVFVKDAAEQYSMVYVTTLENNGQMTTISQGIEEGERIVMNGTYQLKMIYLNQ